MKASDFTYLKRWIGKLVIYNVNGSYNGPSVVFITGVSKNGKLRGDVLNTHTHFFGNPKYCIEYSPRLMEKLCINYYYSQTKRGLSENKKRVIKGRM